MKLIDIFFMKLNLPKSRIMMISASIIRRMLAFVIDFLILNLVVIGPFRKIINHYIPFTGFMDTYTYMQQESSLTTIYVVIGIVTTLVMIYFVLLERMFGQSIGKMIMKIFVIHCDIKIKEISTWQAFLRNICLLPIFPFLLLWIIDPIVLIFTKDNQRLSELLSKTRTVQYVEL